MVVIGPVAEATTWTDPKVSAALAAGVAAFVTRRTLPTLGIGMIALWLLQAAIR